MSTSLSLSRFQQMRQRARRWGRLGVILFRRILLRSARFFRSRFGKSDKSASKTKGAGQFSRNFRALRLKSQIGLYRVRGSSLKQPGWILATVTGTLGILLLLIVQVMAFFSSAVVESTTNDFGDGYEEANLPEQHASLDETVDEPLFSIKATAELDLDVILLSDQHQPEPAEQFLVTSVHRLHPLADLAVHQEESRWQPIRFSQLPSEIQPIEHQTFPNTEIPQPGFRLLSSIATSAMTEVVTPRLYLEIKLPEKIAISQPGRIHFRVVNVGDISAENVTVGIEIPETFTYFKGRSLEYNFGTIPLGETRLARLTPVADQIGPAEFEVELTADAGFSKILRMQVEVLPGK